MKKTHRILRPLGKKVEKAIFRSTGMFNGTKKADTAIMLKEYMSAKGDKRHLVLQNKREKMEKLEFKLTKQT